MNISKPIKDFFEEAGALSIFTGRFFRELFRPRFEITEMLRQCYFIGVKSLPLVLATAFIMGMVLTIQSRPTLVSFGAESRLPQMVAVSLVREIAPVITALICAGKIGSGIGAELGSMKVTEQIDAMEVSGTNPYKYLVVTRVLATMLMLPLLALVSDAVGIWASFLGANIKGDVSWDLFLLKSFDYLFFIDIFPAVFKTFLFGFAIGIVGCYKGMTSQKGTEGVGQSANSAVVLSSLMVFVIDLLVVQLSDLFGIIK
jgi:phospholipid/cholesterol/gamma-HCH transport system permease protein